MFQSCFNRRALWFVGLALCLLPFGASAQIRFSEIAPTSTELTDEDNEHGDWFELENAGNQPVSIYNYAVTDDGGQPTQWRFPDVTLFPGEHHVVFASGKNRPADPGAGGGGSFQVHHWETAVKDGSTWQYTLGAASVSPNWIKKSFVPVGWGEGPGGIGYGDNDDQTEVPEGTLSVYARCLFDVTDKSKITAVLFNADVDDGFVAYLNGVEIARLGLSGTPPAWDELASDHEAALQNGGLPTLFELDLATVQGLLVNGQNLLAVQVHNTSPGSSDLTLRPFLHFGMADNGTQFASNPAWFDAPVGSVPDNLHTNFKIKSGEQLRLYTPTGVLADSITVRNDLRSGHVQFRQGNTWCVSNQSTPNQPNNGTCYTGYSAAPTLSLTSGFYAGNQTLTISGTNVYYTSDGYTPDLAATPYGGPILLTQNTVIRANATETGKLPSEPVSGVYLLNEPTELPVVSITAEPDDLFFGGDGPAIYDDYNSGLKVPCHVAYFDAGRELRFSENASARIVGNFSTAFAQKSLQFLFEDEFGAAGDVPNALFNQDKPTLGNLHGFRIRNTDDDAANARMRDAVANALALPTHAAATASQNVAVFINGEYWGHYSARELLNEYFVRDNYGVDPDSVDVVKTYVGNTFADAGNLQDFNALKGFLTNVNLSQANNFAVASEWVDLDNWADYWATQIFVANGDWYSSMYQNNTQAFRGYGVNDTKWKFVLWDVGYSQGLFGGESAADFNSLDFALTNPAFPNQYTEMFNALLENSEYKRYFINRFADLLNTEWKTAAVHSKIDAQAAALTSEIAANFERWTPDCNNYYCPPDLAYWQDEVARLKQFYTDRPAQQRAHLVSHFGLEKTVDITLQVQPAGAGVVKISTVTPQTYPWTGTYFDGNPVTVSVEARPGYTFEGWSPNALISNLLATEFTANATTATTFVTNFSGAALALDVTVSEINYNSDPSTASGNWIELHNFGTAPANLGGYRLQEQGAPDFYTIPTGTTIAANGYLVLVDDLAQFQTAYPGVTAVGSTLISLGNNGDTLELRDPTGALVLTIGYNDGGAWPQCADGYGRTLESAFPNALANSLDPANWFNGCMGGSPGAAYAPCNEELIFNEINYKSATNAEAGDWVELWNKSGQPLNLSGWQLRDSRDTLRYTFPNGTVLLADSFLVIYSNLAQFQAIHPGAAPNKIGPFQFALDGNGEILRLFDQDEKLYLSMFYNDAAPWPLAPDGEGPTLELKAPFTDLNVGQNWAASCDRGTPGRYNSPCATPTQEVDNQVFVKISPNPSSGVFVVEMPDLATSAWRVYDLSGRLWRTAQVPVGADRWTVDTGATPDGLYVLELVLADGALVRRRLVVAKD